MGSNGTESANSAAGGAMNRAAKSAGNGTAQSAAAEAAVGAANRAGFGTAAFSPFVHLHVHTHYSLLDGATRIPDLVGACKSMNMPAVAITDHGNLFGAIEFYRAAKAAGVKPIIGLETYMAPGDRRDKSPAGPGKETAYHLLLLAADLTGYRNLMKLASIAYLEGFYYKPRIDKAALREFSAGLLCTSTCLAGEIPNTLLNADAKAARAVAEEYLDIFGPERFFIELQNHEIPEQRATNPELAEIARRLGLMTIATNDVHYLSRDDADAHDILCCISTRARKLDENRFKFPPGGHFYLKSPAEMASMMPEYSAALSNTLRVAGMCNLELDFGKRYAPVYRPPAEKTADEYFRELVYAGAMERYGIESREQGTGSRAECDRAESTKGVEGRGAEGSRDRGIEGLRDQGIEGSRDREVGDRKEGGGNREQGKTAQSKIQDPKSTNDADAPIRVDAIKASLPAELVERIEYELSVIASKGFSSYFLIVWDFVRYARENDIPCSARGSGCSTVVGYCLRISDADPLRYGLYFERFMDPERDEMPDIDIDMCQDRRAEVIDYVRRKYGHVAQIITFGTLKARAAIRDVCRALDVPLGEADRVAKLVPEELKMTIEKALEREPELRRVRDSDARFKEVLDVAVRLEGLARHASVHAAGVVIADKPLDELVPLYKPSDSNDVITQFEGGTVEKVGLLKMDFLGLRTLSQVHLCRKLVQQNHGRLIDLESLDLTDATVYKLLARGETKGIFQFESGGMRDVLLKMKPNRVEDLIAANALFRPGPMQYINEYCARKHGKPWTTPHAIMTDVLNETYGIMVYQEQVSRLVNRLGGVPLRRAFRLAKAISKKKTDMIEAEREPFLEGAGKNGVSLKIGEQIFADILEFGGYAFNKAHSTGYALLAFQTAYLKTYYPLEFMASLLTYESGSTEKIAEYIHECRHVRQCDAFVGIPVNAPDVNASDKAFTVVYDEVTSNESRVTSESGVSSEARSATNHDTPIGSTNSVLLTRRSKLPGRGRILFGLAAISGLGEKAVASILDARRKQGRFRDIYDFCERVDLQTVNKGAMESLIKCGAFDSTGAMRRALMEILPRAMDHGSGMQRDTRAGQMSMFGNFAAPDAAPPLPIPTVEWSEAEMLANEKETLGFFVTRHPLTQHLDTIERLGTAEVAALKQMADGTQVVLGGLISKIREIPIKNGRSAGKKMCAVVVEDLTGSVEAIVFPDSLDKLRPFMRPDSVVFAVGSVDRRREEPSIRVDSLVPIENAVRELSKAVLLRLPSPDDAIEQLPRVHEVCRRNRGRCPLFLEIASRDGWTTTIRADDAFFVAPAAPLLSEFESLVGPGNALCVGSRSHFG